MRTASDRNEVIHLIGRVAGHCLVNEVLYKWYILAYLFKCLSLAKSIYVLWEIHEGIYGLRIGSKALTAQVTKAGFYWPIIINDATNLVKWCD